MHSASKKRYSFLVLLFVAMNRGADFIKPLILSLRARTRNLNRHRDYA